MRAVGVIPARFASTRLPGKSLVNIAGKPLIRRVVERARQATRLDAILVATDDARIAAEAEAAGARGVITRPDHPSGTDRVAEAVADDPAEIVLNIQGDEPFVDPGLIDRVVDALAGNAGWEMVTAACPIHDAEELESRTVVKVVWAADGRALYFSRLPIPCVRDGRPPPGGRPLHWRHIGLYGYRRDVLARMTATPPCALEKAEKLEQLRALHLGARIRVLETKQAGIGIDTPEDVAYADRLIQDGVWPA
jgi:3-deoxy-manno-octulosonate cytidylyltransferase (CMP-KDO synthetase)